MSCHPLKPLAMLALVGCQDHGIKAFNADPEATITSHASGDEVDTEVVVQLAGRVSDPDDGAEDLLAAWRVGTDEVCPPAPPDADGSSRCEIVFTDDSTVVLEVVDPGSASGRASVDLLLRPTGAPEARIIQPEPGGVYYSDQLIPFEAVLSDEEDDASSLLARWESSLAGELDLDVAPSSEGSILDHGYLPEGEHAIELAVEDSSGKTSNESVVIQVGPPNGAPTCAVMAPVSGSTGEAGALVLFEAEVADVDVPADWLDVGWQSDKDGFLGSSVPDSTGEVSFPWSNLSADTHVISMTVTDEVGATCTDSVIYTVLPPNNPPVVSSVVLAPATAYTDDTLAASATATDADGDAISLSYAWYVDGSLVAASGSSLDGRTFFDKGQQVHVVVTPADETGSGSPMTSATVTIQNSPPEAPAISIVPSSPLEDEDLRCVVDVASVDADGDASTYRAGWTVDGAASSGASTTTFPDDTMPAAVVLRDEVWACTVTPNDGTDDGSTATTSVTPGNAFGDWAAESSITTADYSFVGVASDWVRTVAGADLDRDGLSDIVVGTQNHDGTYSNAGAAFIVFSTSLGSTTPISLLNADITLHGSAADAGAGNILQFIGDVGGDGTPELVVTEHLSDSSGIAYLLDGAQVAAGSATQTLSSTADIILYGEAAGDWGNRAAAAGDVDGDGIPELLTGSWGNDDAGSRAGKTYLFLGGNLPATGSFSMDEADHTWIGSTTVGNCGYMVNGLGDLNSDGYDDFAYYCRDSHAAVDDGIVFIVMGGSLGSTSLHLATSADHCIYGDGEDDELGTSIAWVGDVTGDGNDEIVLSAPNAGSGTSQPGQAYVIQRASLGGSCTPASTAATWVIEAEADGDHLTARSYTPTDIDGDGLDDLLLQAGNNDDAATTAGKVYLLLAGSLGSSGTLNLSSADHAWTGPNAGDTLGREADFVGDVNGDGVHDIMVTSMYSDTGGVDAGEAWLLFGD